MSSFPQRPHYRADCAHADCGRLQRLHLEGKWGRADLCNIQRCHFHGRDRCHIQDFEARLCFRTHSSHGAARCVCFTGPAGGFSKIPVSPPLCLAFKEHKVLHYKVPLTQALLQGIAPLLWLWLYVPLVLAEHFAFPLKPAKRARHQHDARVTSNANMCNKHANWEGCFSKLFLGW